MRFAIGYITPDGSLEVVESGREAISLGRSVFEGGEISSRTLQASCVAFRKFKDAIDEFEVESLRAVGTSALREATNQREFCDAVLQASGIEVDVISGNEEAALIRDAVIAAMSLRDEDALLLDIGGGSIELSLLSRGALLFSVSEKMGAVRLLKRIAKSEESGEAFGRLVRWAIIGFLEGLDRAILPKKIDIFAGTGGNIEALGELRLQIFEKRNPRKIKVAELEQMVEILLKLSYRERIQRFGLREDRADVIVPGAIVLLEVMKYAGVSDVRIPKVGLREGVLRKLLAKSAG